MYVGTDISVRTKDCMEIIVWKRRVRGGQEIRGIINKIYVFGKAMFLPTLSISLFMMSIKPSFASLAPVLAPSLNSSSLLLLKVTLLLLILVP